MSSIFCSQIELSEALQNCESRLAQLVERKTLNLVVVGSSPTVGVHFLFPGNFVWSASRAAPFPKPGWMAERSKALVLGTSLFGGVGSNPTPIRSQLFLLLSPLV